MTDAEKALERAMTEAQEAACDPAMPCSQRHVVIGRALDLVRKVGRLEQAERTVELCNATEKRPDADWKRLVDERDQLWREIEEATK